jgi:small subunit ribosomal protein S2
MTDRCVNCKAEKEAEHTFPEADHVRIEVKRKISELPKQKTAKANLAQTAKKTARSNPAATRSIAAQEAAFRHAENVTLPIGSTLTPHYQPNQLVFNPPSPSEVTLELLMASQAHLGHATSRWNPMNSRYIYGERQGVHIISLDQTASHLRRACRIVSGVTERGGLVLFVGTRPGQDLAVIEAATNAGGCHLFEKWKPGSITNSNQILRECEVKAVDDFDREIKGYEDELMELAALKPDLVVCLNPLENWVLLHECGQFNVPTIGIIDTDADPTWVTYPIPANDDSIRAIQVIAGALGMAGKEGKQARLAKAVNGSDLEYATVDMEKLRKDMAIPERRA